MNVATAYYAGRQRRHSRRGPSGQRYHFARGVLGASDQPAKVESVKDALFFANHDAFEVEWSAVGQVARLSQELESPANEIEATLKEMGYRQKQQLAKSLGMKAGGTEDELEERLKPEVKRLQQQMEEL